MNCYMNTEQLNDSGYQPPEIYLLEVKVDSGYESSLPVYTPPPFTEEEW